MDAIPPPPPRRRRVYLEDVAPMRALRAAGWSCRQIARRHGCSPATVSLVINGKYPVALTNRPAEAADSALFAL